MTTENILRLALLGSCLSLAVFGCQLIWWLLRGRVMAAESKARERDKTMMLQLIAGRLADLDQQVKKLVKVAPAAPAAAPVPELNEVQDLQQQVVALQLALETKAKQRKRQPVASNIRHLPDQGRAVSNGAPLPEDHLI